MNKTQKNESQLNFDDIMCRLVKGPPKTTKPKKKNGKVEK